MDWRLLKGRTVAMAAMGLLISSLILGVTGCNSSGCLENRNSVPLAGFYNSNTGAILSLDSVQITGEGMPEDRPLLEAGKNTSSIYLPMRSTQQSTSWVFSYKWTNLDNPQLNDTVSFVYESTPYFASNDCGVIYKYLITEMSYTKHLMDSVVLADSLITNLDIEQIKIYFRTSSSGEGEGDE